MSEYIQLQSGIIIAESEFAEMKQARPEMREVATTRDGRDITRGYVDSLPLLQPQDNILQARGAGDYAIYDEILRDDQVSATFQQRRLAVVSREWEVMPGGKKRRDKQAADHLSEVLESIRWDSVTDKMLYGVFYGYAISEALWARDGRHITLDALKVRDRRRFAFAPDSSLRLKTSANPNGEELPPRKFWHFATGASHDDEPYGLGLAHWLYWPVLFKRNGLKFWLIFLEKFGMPTGMGKFPVNATADERNRLLQAVQAIQADAGIIIPDGMQLELLEAARSGSADYSKIYDRMDAAISKVTVGQTMTTDNGSSRSQAEVHMDVRQDLVKADSDLVCYSFSRSIGRWLTDWNYPGAEYPTVWRRIDDEPDLKPQAERDKVIYDMGFKPTLAYVKETYGDGWEERDPQPSQTTGKKPVQPAGEQPNNAEFAETLQRDVVDAYVDRMQENTAPAFDTMIDRVRQLLDEVDSLEEFEQRLLGAFNYLEPGELASVMRMGMATAELAGRYEVQEGE